MKSERVSEVKDLVIVGLAIRTSPASAGPDIGAAWQRFMSEGTAQRVERDPEDAHIYAVYCDYESDHAGPYTMVLGVAADPKPAVPVGLRRVRVPSGAFQRFMAHGAPERALWETWSHINRVWEKPGARRYIADFERYVAMAEGTVTAEVYVGLS